MSLYEIAVRLILADRSVRPRRCAPPVELDGRIDVDTLARSSRSMPLQILRALCWSVPRAAFLAAHKKSKQSAAWTDRPPTASGRYTLPESALAPELHVDETAVADDHERLFKATWNSCHSAGHARPV